MPFGTPDKSVGDNPTTTTLPFYRALKSVISVGRELLAKQLPANALFDNTAQSLITLCKDLIEHRGEASGIALAEEIASGYTHLDDEQKLQFLNSLAQDFDVDQAAILRASQDYSEDPTQKNLERIAHAVEAPRRKLFRRINMAPGGTSTLVGLRGDVLDLLPEQPQLAGVDSDLKHLFVYWFNKGFLELRQIDWSSPASLLEKLFAYEAVHEINGWEDLRGRLKGDRRCFAFLHPAMGDDPIVFVEVALTNQIPDSIAPLIAVERTALPIEQATTVVFYSISNCHPGLAGISFGNFLIKNVVSILASESDSLNTFVTLSPIPGFRKWLQDTDLSELVDADTAEKVRQPIGAVVGDEVRAALMRLCAHYLLREKRNGLAVDPVARFHLGNGASLHQLHWGADLTRNGKLQSAGIMVNYLYDVQNIEINHEEYFGKGKINASRAIVRLLG